jgi:hypothetical protein
MLSCGQQSVDFRGVLTQHDVRVNEVIHGQSFLFLDAGEPRQKPLPFGKSWDLVGLRRGGGR